MTTAAAKGKKEKQLPFQKRAELENSVGNSFLPIFPRQITPHPTSTKHRREVLNDWDHAS